MDRINGFILSMAVIQHAQCWWATTCGSWDEDSNPGPPGSEKSALPLGHYHSLYIQYTWHSLLSKFLQWLRVKIEHFFQGGPNFSREGRNLIFFLEIVKYRKWLCVKLLFSCKLSKTNPPAPAPILALFQRGSTTVKGGSNPNPPSIFTLQWLRDMPLPKYHLFSEEYHQLIHPRLCFFPSSSTGALYNIIHLSVIWIMSNLSNINHLSLLIHGNDGIVKSCSVEEYLNIDYNTSCAWKQ